MEQTYFRKGFGLKTQVKPIIDAEYHSQLVDRIRARGYTDVFGDVTVRLAQEFGFCYGVDRAIDYAYETVRKFPGRDIYLVGEIIHNPHVNQRMREMGIHFIYPRDDKTFDFSHLTAQDVVLIPAFGVTRHDFKTLQGIGCVLVDTTCGSVLNVWKRVERYARDGFTAIVHGKYTHEESRATASQVTLYDGGKYLIVRNREEAKVVCDYIAHRPGSLSTEAFTEHFREKATPGFDPERDLCKVGVANQTTMLANESLAIAGRVRGDGRGTWGRLRPRVLSLLRHHLLGHPGEAGRGQGYDGPAAGHHGRDRRLQLIQHQPPRQHVPRVHRDLPRRGRVVHRRDDGNGSPQAGTRPARARGDRARLAPRRTLRTRDHGRRLDSEQQDRGGAGARPGDSRGASGRRGGRGTGDRGTGGGG